MELASITIHGEQSTWAVNWHTTPKEIEAMRADGIEVFEIENIIPAWVVDAGLTRTFVFFQDLWNFKNPFKE